MYNVIKWILQCNISLTERRSPPFIADKQFISIAMSVNL